jgi:hypothetical protein
MSESTKTEAIDLLWGAKAIGDEINKTVRQTFHLLETGMLPARKVGKHWVAERGTLHAFFRGDG